MKFPFDRLPHEEEGIDKALVTTPEKVLVLFPFDRLPHEEEGDHRRDRFYFH